MSKRTNCMLCNNFILEIGITIDNESENFIENGSKKYEIYITSFKLKILYYLIVPLSR